MITESDLDLRFDYEFKTLKVILDL